MRDDWRMEIQAMFDDLKEKEKVGFDGVEILDAHVYR